MEIGAGTQIDFFSHLLYGGHRFVPCHFVLFLAIPILWMMQSHYLNNCADRPFSPAAVFFVWLLWLFFWFVFFSACCFCLLFWFCVGFFFWQRDSLSGLCTGPLSARPALFNANMLHANIACGSTWRKRRSDW